MSSDSPALKAKFDDPNYLEEGEQMFKDKFSENLQVKCLIKRDDYQLLCFF